MCLYGAALGNGAGGWGWGGGAVEQEVRSIVLEYVPAKICVLTVGRVLGG